MKIEPLWHETNTTNYVNFWHDATAYLCNKVDSPQDTNINNLSKFSCTRTSPSSCKFSQCCPKEMLIPSIQYITKLLSLEHYSWKITQSFSTYCCTYGRILQNSFAFMRSNFTWYPDWCGLKFLKLSVQDSEALYLWPRYNNINSQLSSHAPFIAFKIIIEVEFYTDPKVFTSKYFVIIKFLHQNYSSLYNFEL